MRVISQDGTFDAEYEHVSIQCFGCSVFFINDNSESAYKLYGRNMKAAEYSSEEKALKAMKMLREQYENLEVFKVLSCGTTEYMERVLTEEKLNKYIKSYYKLNTFQFPKDSEVEV